MSRHPIQPLETDKDDVVRFKSNAIVKFLLDAGPFDMNRLAFNQFSNEDREQFAQLIGYSLSGFGELEYVSMGTYNAAQRMHYNGDDEKDARIAELESIVARVRSGLREAVPCVFDISRDALK